MNSPDEENLRISRHRFLVSTRCVQLGLMVVIINLGLIGFFRQLHPVERQQPRWKSCGDNPQTALERGRSFDLISFAWQTPECYDAEIVKGFITHNEPDGWTFYDEMDRNVAVSQETATLGLQNLGVSWRHHVVHCTYAWRQMHRAFKRGWIRLWLGEILREILYQFRESATMPFAGPSD
jgi:hypothetical protein